MLTPRQQEILDCLKEKPFVPARELRRTLKLTRGRIHQLIGPLVRRGLVKKEGSARATVYLLSEKRSNEEITRENWDLRKKNKELEKMLEDRKVIEQAKEILIAQFGILPTEAYRKLQEQSMDSGRSMREIAESILCAYEV
jgi:DNA-binding MarR family transcriptional regulator